MKKIDIIGEYYKMMDSKGDRPIPFLVQKIQLDIDLRLHM